MVRWLHLFGKTDLGFWPLGLALFFLQELPYLVMPFLALEENPIMNMVEASPGLNFLEKLLGISCVLVMCFVIYGEAPLFSLASGREKLGFFLAALALLGYYLGWFFYAQGHQSLSLMLGALVLLPPLYYAAIGLWRGHWLLSGLGLAFGGVHFLHVYVNFRGHW
ncbi:MAG: hypothetical protein Q4E76_05790 [Tissierellia bacterium]|nr:hypothetical protein [Tissierellia bacterium]